MGSGNLGSGLLPLLTSSENYTIYIMSIVVSAIGMSIAAVTIYWFAMMKRNFRQQLVLFLILAELFKSCWYMISSSVLLATTNLSSETSFCQAGGFFLQVGVAACDIGVLFISIHTSLQVFHSGTRMFGQTGLYRFRHAVLTLWIIVPVLIAALAFTNPSGLGYVMSSSFCKLPIRSYWYTLALSWIPRYLIMAYILSVAIRICRHVRTRLTDDAPQANFENSIEINTAASRLSQYHRDVTQLHQLYKKSGRPMPLPTIRDPSDYCGVKDCVGEIDATCLSQPRPCYADSTREKRPSVVNEIAPPRSRQQSIEDPNSPRTRIIGSMLMSPMDRSVAETWGTYDHKTAGKKTVGITVDEGEIPSDSSHERRQEAIQREVRLLFVYPVVYLVGWLVPLIANMFNYSNYYARHPIYTLAALSTFCQIFLPIADCLVFAWREHPWRQIPGSDGSFWGSFAFWTFGDATRTLPSSTITSQYRGPAMSSEATWVNQAPKSPQSRQAPSFDHLRSPTSPRNVLNTFQPSISRKSSSAQSDHALHEAHWAHQRLELERADRLSLPSSRKGSAVSDRGQDWWERRVSEVLRAPILEDTESNV